MEILASIMSRVRDYESDVKMTIRKGIYIGNVDFSISSFLKLIPFDKRQMITQIDSVLNLKD